MAQTCSTCGYEAEFPTALCSVCGASMGSGPAGGGQAAPPRRDSDRWEKTVYESTYTPTPGARQRSAGDDFYEPLSPGRGERARFSARPSAGASSPDDSGDHTIIDRRQRGDDPPAAEDRTIIVREGRRAHEGPLAYLIERSGIRAGKAHLLQKETIIGRHHEADIVIGDESVSRRHAAIKLEDGKFILWDLASANFSKMVEPDGRRVRILAPRELTDLAEIELGEVRFTFIEVDDAAR